MQRRLVFAAAAACALLAGRSAWAESSAQAIEQSRAAFERGVALVEQERWVEALGSFDESLRLYPTQTALFNRALCLALLGRPVEALRDLEEHRRRYGDTVDEERRAQVEEELARIRQRVGWIEVQVQGAETAVVLLDGQEVGQTPLAEPLMADPGRHELTVRAPDMPPMTRTVTVDAGEVEPVVLQLDQIEATDEPSIEGGGIAITPESEERDPGFGLRIGGYVSAGLAVATLGAALGLFLWNNSQFEEWEDEDARLAAALEDTDRVLWEELGTQISTNDSRSDSVHVVEAVSWAMLGLGSAAVVATTVLLIAGFRRRQAERPASAIVLPVLGGSAVWVWF